MCSICDGLTDCDTTKGANKLVCQITWYTSRALLIMLAMLGWFVCGYTLWVCSRGAWPHIRCIDYCLLSLMIMIFILAAASCDTPNHSNGMCSCSLAVWNMCSRAESEYFGDTLNHHLRFELVQYVGINTARTTEACTTKPDFPNLDMLELAGWPNPKHTRSR